ncbi:deoxyribodipyrimidine photo-lyase [Sulfuricurvum sp.]|uniref:cryptochrome/photolyase family protein n=1 Tax=Sulfuricurvum sp. TaxID=2025608 RepID=UPI0026247AAE|nr:deoxyribodipyrimidine photo-lyase [Sulfuricurvum sp.]MDD4883239.1 deoxyribodipyrimidine photo-lyase [Sulfuricurvum sp.]
MPENKKRRILWFRRDLRTEDNPLLSFEGEVLPIFIFDSEILDSLERNDRRVGFIFQTLVKLKTELQQKGLNLALFYGKPVDVFRWLLAGESYDEVCASGDYDPYAIERDREISHLLPFRLLQDTYIFRPDEVLKNDGNPYLVFTPFYNQVKKIFRPEHMQEYLPARQSLCPFDYDGIHHIRDSYHHISSVSAEAIGFNPLSLSDFQQCSPRDKLRSFASALKTYSTDRDYPALNATSHLGVDLRFGTLSIRALLRWLRDQKTQGVDTEPYFRQLIFREFYAMLLYHFPHLSYQNFRYPFHGVENQEYFKAYCTASTGVPIIDAGIRELLETGEMPNRIRMICASFFTKNLLLPWQWGEAFFARHLIDYDAASNILSWQWSSGTGVDPQPYFRVFNPYVQTKKFDTKGAYIRKWLPHLDHIDPKILSDERKIFDSSLPHYPRAIVRYKNSTDEAINYFNACLKQFS